MGEHFFHYDGTNELVRLNGGIWVTVWAETLYFIDPLNQNFFLEASFFF